MAYNNDDNKVKIAAGGGIERLLAAIHTHKDEIGVPCVAAAAAPHLLLFLRAPACLRELLCCAPWAKLLALDLWR
jgi:hypothetical protein